MSWNSFNTAAYQGMTAAVTSYVAGGGDLIHAYVARPLGDGPFPGVVLIQHGPGWDEIYREFTRRFAAHGYVACCPDLNCRAGHGRPEDVNAKVRAAGGNHDDQVVADVAAAQRWVKSLPVSNGKVGLIGSCASGRLTVLVASRSQGWDAAVDLWGGRVVARPEELTAEQPVAPIEYTKDLCAPLLGIFGNDDASPSPEQVNVHEAELKRHGKVYSFHRYDGAGHAFFNYDRPSYRQEQAMDGWHKVFAFFGQYLR